MPQLNTVRGLFERRTPMGAFAWSTDEKGRRVLWLRVPNASCKTGVEVLCLYPSRAPNNWAAPGDTNGWNGDVDQPTFKPSIQAGAWHGFLTHGELSAKSCDADCCRIPDRLVHLTI